MADLFEEGFTQNREISWLRYDERVLDEALDESVPLFERLNFISIFVSNLEEFFKVRVGSLIGEDDEGDEERDSRSGMTAGQQLEAIHAMIPLLLEKKDLALAIVERKLAAAGIERVEYSELNGNERSMCTYFFRETVVRKIKTAVISPDQPLPYLDENRPYIISRLVAEDGDRYGIVDFPEELPKILVLDPGISESSNLRYILTEDVIKMHINNLFAPFQAIEIFTIDIARNAEVETEEDTGDQLSEMKEIVEKRKYSAPDKLIADGEMSYRMTEYLRKALKLDAMQIFRTTRIDFGYVGEVEDAIPERLRASMCFAPFQPFNQLNLSCGHYNSVIDRIKHEEILSCYPYDSMDPFLDLLKEASADESVKSISMTIYRLASQPKIVEYLTQAAANGKKVKVLMELRARFDEAKNIDWSEKLKACGCKVYFGDEKYKVHSKLCQIVLEGSDGEDKYITHLSTGNFNEKTAKKYTDISLITYDQRIGRDADEFFRDVFKNKEGKYDHLLTSPKTMQDEIVHLIRKEASKGKDGRIFIKVNSVTDVRIIEELMEASCAGCRIRMIVRGICCILPGVEFCTENIQIVSLVGRLLEHSRVYIFGEGKDEKMYISSADIMTRNMTKRVELACPIYNESFRKRIKSILYLNFMDNVKGRMMTPQGIYVKKSDEGPRIDSQQMLIDSIS